MTSRARRAVLAAAVAAAGAGLVAVVVGLWFAVRLTPAGVAEFRATTPASGVVVVPPRYVNALDAPVEIVATRGDGGPVWIGQARAADADELLRRGARSVVTELSYVSGSAQLRSAGSGPLTGVHASDIWSATEEGERRARLLVLQRDAPTTVVVTSGTEGPLLQLTLTMSWRNGTWFVQSLVLALLGALVAAGALILLWRRRSSSAAGKELS